MAVGDVTAGPAIVPDSYSLGPVTLKRDGSGNFGIELGDPLATGKTAYIDLHFGAGSAQDFNVRIANDADGRIVVSMSGNNDALVVQASGVGVGAVPGTSVALGVTSTAGAFLPPKMTSTQRDALTPSNGMVLYNTTTDKLQCRQAGAWVDLA